MKHLLPLLTGIVFIGVPLKALADLQTTTGQGETLEAAYQQALSAVERSNCGHYPRYSFTIPQEAKVTFVNVVDSYLGPEVVAYQVELQSQTGCGRFPW